MQKSVYYSAYIYDNACLIYLGLYVERSRYYSYSDLLSCIFKGYFGTKRVHNINHSYVHKSYTFVCTTLPNRTDCVHSLITLPTKTPASLLKQTQNDRIQDSVAVSYVSGIANCIGSSFTACTNFELLHTHTTHQW